MTQTKHTAGEWVAKPATLNIKDLMFYKADVIAGGIRVAQVAGIGEECANANARLIASAPELLEALKDIIEQIDNRGLKMKIAESYELAKQAVAKADGQS